MPNVVSMRAKPRTAQRYQEHVFRIKDLSRGVELQFDGLSDPGQRFTIDTVRRRMTMRPIGTPEKSDDVVFMTDDRGHKKSLTAGYLATSAAWSILK